MNTCGVCGIQMSDFYVATSSHARRDLCEPDWFLLSITKSILRARRKRMKR